MSFPLFATGPSGRGSFFFSVGSSAGGASLFVILWFSVGSLKRWRVHRSFFRTPIISVVSLMVVKCFESING